MQNEKYYLDKFIREMNRLNYIKRSDEIIKQCNEPYPPYWFISNKGYLFSVYHDIRIIKPNYRRTVHNWFYRVHSNTPPVPMQKLIAKHFLNEFVADGTEEEQKEIHHIKKVLSFGKDKPHKANAADNLQTLPKSIHNQLTYMGSHTIKEQDKAADGKAKKSGVETQYVTREQMNAILKSFIPLSPVVECLQSVNDDKDKVKTVACELDWNRFIQKL